MKKFFVMAVLISVFLIAGCAEKKVVKPVQPEMEQQQQPSATAPKETKEKKGTLKPEERITERQLAKVETKDELAKYKEESGLFKDIYFDFDRYDVQQDAKAVLGGV